VDDRLRVLDDSGAPIPGLYAMGDCASVKGYHLPATAQVAAQEGTYLAAGADRVGCHLAPRPPATCLIQCRPRPCMLATRAPALNTLARDRAAEVPPFSFRNFGVLAYLGGWTALFDKSQANKDAIRVSGRAAWLLWRSAYLTKTVSWRNKVLIPVYWYACRCPRLSTGLIEHSADSISSAVLRLSGCRFVTWVFGRDIGRL